MSGAEGGGGPQQANRPEGGSGPARPSGPRIVESKHSPIKAAVDLIADTRVAVGLILVCLGWVLIGVFVPQADYLGSEQMAAWRAAAPGWARAASDLGFDRIFTQWYFLSSVGLLGLSLVVCVLRRFTRREHQPPVPFLSEGAAEKRALVWHPKPIDVEEAADAAAAALGRHLAVRRRQAGAVISVTGIGGRAGFVGSVVFHTALLLAGVGVVIGILTTFTGEAILTVGQSVPIEQADFVGATRVPLIGKPPSGFTVALDSVTLDYERGRPVDVAARMRVLEDGREARSEVARVNYPLEHRDVFMLLWRTGHAARLSVSQGGRLLDDAFVNLKNKVQEGYTDSYRLPDGRRLEILLVPDSAAGLGRPAVEPLKLTSPAAYLRLADSTGTSLGPVTVGTQAEVGGYVIRLEEARLWVSFFTRSTRGRLLLYAALWLGIVGTALRFVDPKREVMVAIRPARAQGGPGPRAGSVASELAVLARGRYGSVRLAPALGALEKALGVTLAASGSDERAKDGR